MKIRNFLLSVIPIFSINFVSAHCPLCTIGAGAVAGGAVWLGVSKLVVAMFLGAFAMSMALWFSRIVKKQYIPFQKTIIFLAVFLTTLIPLLPFFKAVGPLYLSFMGEYGTTYAVNYSLATSLLGAVIVFVSPFISKKITKIRKGKIIPFQGVMITLISLIIIGGIMQVLV